jgi:hypothetical protein
VQQVFAIYGAKNRGKNAMMAEKQAVNYFI